MFGLTLDIGHSHGVEDVDELFFCTHDEKLIHMVITADIAMKNANVDLGFVDRFSGTLIITGRVSEVESAFHAIADYFRDTLHFAVCDVTKT